MSVMQTVVMICCIVCFLQPVLDYVDGNGVSYYIDMDSVQCSSATSEEGYGDWSGADYLLSS